VQHARPERHDDGLARLADTVLVLQQGAALIDRLGVAETLLCPAPAGKGRYGNIDEEIDLTGDGTPEVVSVHLFPEQNEGMIYDDNSSFIGYSAYRVVDPQTGRTEYSDENVKKTYEQIRRFSHRDAEVFQ